MPCKAANPTSAAPLEPIRVAGGTDPVIGVIEPTLAKLTSLAEMRPHFYLVVDLILLVLTTWDVSTVSAPSDFEHLLC